MSTEDVKKPPETLLNKGMKVRQVAGQVHVKHSMAGVSDFAVPIQHTITKVCWGAICGRRSLERKARFDDEISPC